MLESFSIINWKHKCFPVYFAKCLRTPFFVEHLGETAFNVKPKLLQRSKNLTNNVLYSLKVYCKDICILTESS